MSTLERLRSILLRYAAQLVVVSDTETNYSLDVNHVMANKQRLFLGAASVRKNYVSFYLMPVYVHPELLEDISPELRKRHAGQFVLAVNC